MADPVFEFIVSAYELGERFTVIGRCGDLPIRVGDTFDAIYRYKRRRYPDEMGETPVRERELPASVRVVCIHAYERSLPMLGQGMTGSLAVEGEGLEDVGAGWVLGRRSEATPPNPDAGPVSAGAGVS